jgi:pyruvate,orthophosphate dikinase
MPGMMDTILDLGCTDAVERALAAETGDAAFAAEVHRRFCGFYGRLVLGCTEELDELPDTAAVRAAVLEDTGEHIPDDPWEQLRAAVAAVFASSRSRRAVAYRKHYGIPDDLGTAVAVTGHGLATSTTCPAPGCCSPATRERGRGLRQTSERGQGEDVSPAGHPETARAPGRALPAGYAGLCWPRSADTRAATPRTSSSPCNAASCSSASRVRSTARAAVGRRARRRGAIEPADAVRGSPRSKCARPAGDRARRRQRAAARVGAARGGHRSR